MAKPKRPSKQSSEQQAQNPVLSPKEQLALKQKAARERQEFIQFTTFAVFGAVFVGLLLYAIAGPKAAAGSIGTILCLSLSFKYPRQAVWAFLIYMPFSGTVTYALAGGNALFQLAKDAFYIPAIIGFFRECKQKRLPFLLPKEIMPTLGLLLAVSLMTLLFINGSQQLNPKPGEKPFLLGILGLKVLMGYIPLISCAYYLMRTKRELLFLTRLQVLLAIVCCGLAFTQYMMLETGRCVGTRGLSGDALFKASVEARCFVGGALLYTPEEGVIRLPGTFVAPWQWGWFLISNAFFTFASAFSDPIFLWRMVGLVGMAAVFILAVISGQRIALVLVPISFIVLLFLTGQVANLRRFLPIGIGLGLLLGVAAAMYPDVVQERIDSFVSRWQAAPADDFILNQFGFVWREIKGSLIGEGLGRATNSARMFGNTFLIETWFPKVMFEIGPIGVIIFLAFVTSLTVVTFKAYRSLKDANLRTYGACFWVFILFISYNTYYYPLDVDPVAIYYWFFAGVILKLPDLDRQEALLNPTPTEQPPKGKKRRQTRQPSPA